MGQADTKYIKRVESDAIKDKIINIHVNIKTSTIPSAGLGVFTDEFIEKGTYFIPVTNPECTTDIGKKINDLAYNGNINEYDNLLEQKTNIIYVTTIPNIFSQQVEILCYCAMKNIEKGDEFSRVYGVDYWQNFKFWDTHSYSKWPDTKLDQDLPTDWVAIDSVAPSLSRSSVHQLFAKKDECGRYYYRVDDFDRTDEYFREIAVNQPFKDHYGGNVYRLSHLYAIQPAEPDDIPNVPMFRPYHDLITSCAENNLYTLGYVIDHLSKNEMNDVITKNNGELYSIACKLSGFDIIQCLTKYFSDGVIKSSLHLVIGRNRHDSIDTLRYMYDYVKDKWCTDDITRFIETITFYDIQLSELQWILRTVPQFKITPSAVGTLFSGQESRNDIITYLLTNLPLTDDILVVFFVQYCYKYDITNVQLIYEKIQNKCIIDQQLTYEQFHDFLNPGYYKGIGYYIYDISVEQRVELVDYLLSIKPSLDMRNEKLFRYMNQRHIGNYKSVEVYCRKIPEYRQLDCYINKPQ
jgi:hypothetical protein